MAIGVVGAHPTVVGQGAAPATAAFRSLSTAVVAPLVAYGFILVLMERGILSPALALGAFAASTLTVLGTVAWLTARSLRAEDARRQVVEEQLTASEVRYRELYRHTPVGLFRATPDGAVEEANPRLLEILGLPDVPAVTSFGLLEQLRHEIEASGATAGEGVGPDEPQPHEVRLVRSDGTPIWVQVELRALRDLSGSVTALDGFLLDISRRRRLAEQLHQTQRMDALGRMAAGVAHDFNNLLSVVAGSAELLVVDKAAAPQIREVADEILDAAARGAKLTGELLALARRRSVAPQRIDLHQAILGMRSLLTRALGDGVVLDIRPADGPVVTRVDPVQIDQIVLNLALNARDAMPRGGTLRIDTSVVDVDPAFLPDVPQASAGVFALLAVSDTGEGMDPATALRVFEPFFSTKGTAARGLGLATVLGHVEQAGGFVWLLSEPGRGTKIHIYFPHDPGAAVAAVPPPTEDIVGGSETILIVEDDASVRRVHAHALRSLGYTVIQAAGLDEAIAHTTDPHTRFDLLFTDVLMPGGSGVEVAEAIRASRPEVKVLFASGFVDDESLRRAISEGSVTLIEKPFTRAGVARAVRRVLDG